jgi:hypothetical protein
MKKYITLTSDDSRYDLSVIENSKGEYHLPSLTWKENNGIIDFWDNPNWIKNTLLNHVNGISLNIECSSMIPLTDYDVIKELIEEGLKLGFFKNE